MPDLRGFGWSDVPPGPIGPEVFAADLLALLDALELERADVTGHDWGGFASLLLSAQHPGRVRRLIAISSPHPWLELTPRLALETWRAWYAVLFAGGLMERTERLASWFMAREGVPEADVEAFAARLREPARASTTTRLYRSYLQTLVTQVRGGRPVPRSTTPTLLMIGERDEAVTPRLAEGIERGGDDMRAEIVPGAGHFLVDTHPHVVAERVRSFL
jgi:pimeloyl-ACP methyl ester carboxylesterase